MKKYFEIIAQGSFSPDEYNDLSKTEQEMLESHIDQFQIDRLQAGLKQ